MIIITETFEKSFKKFKWVFLTDLLTEIKKHNDGLNNFKRVWELGWNPVLKWYLQSKNIRVLVLFQFHKWHYLPFYIIKKVSKHWYNISKNNDDTNDIIHNNWLKLFDDLEKWKYKEFNL